MLLLKKKKIYIYILSNTFKKGLRTSNNRAVFTSG